MKKMIIAAMIGMATLASMAQDGKRKVLKDSAQSITNVAQALDAVDVVVKVQKSKMNGDVMVTRIVGSTLSNAGSAEDALAKVPGLMRKNGQVEVIGKGAPVYYINGRKVQDLTELSRLSSQELREVEVINTPGAQYDAQTNAVVRIKTVKRLGEGLGGSLQSTDTYSPSHGDNRLGTTVQLNYRKNGMELFGGGTFDDYQLKGYETDFTQRSIGKEEFYQAGNTWMGQHYRTWHYNLGMDWQLSSDHSLGLKVECRDNVLGRTDYWMNDDIYQNGSLIDKLQTSTLTNANGMDSWSANAYYMGKVGKLGIDWNVDYYQTEEGVEMNSDEQDQTSKRQVKSLNQQDNRLWATKLVMSYPLAKGKLQWGTELSFVNRNNTYEISEQSIANDDAKVKENTYAAFVEWSGMVPVGMLNLGLRYEHVDFDYKSLLDNTQNLTRHSDNLYPTISFATQVKEVQASLSYSVKTQRPQYRVLRSNIEYNNRYTLSTGNPKLKNEINHQLGLNMRYRWLGISANYERKENGIYDWSYPHDEQGTVLLGWVNFDKPINSVSFYANATNTIGHWTPSYTLGVQKQWLSFDLPDPREASGTRTVSYNKPMLICITNNAWKIPSRRDDGTGSWQLEANSELLSTFHWGNAESKNWFWDFSLAVQKSWLENDALSLRLAVYDLFHTAHHNVLIDLGNYQMTQSPINGQSRSVYDPQTVQLSLRYKFNAIKSGYKGKGAGENERKRM